MLAAIVKLAGITVAAAAISVYGAYRAAQITGRRRLRAELDDAVRVIREGIVYGAAPLAEILATVETPLLDAYGFGRLLKSGGGDAFADALRSLRGVIDGETYALYALFAEKLGKGMHTESEEALCSRLLLKRERDEVKIEADEDGKALLYKRLGLLAGLAAALVLL